MGCACDPYSLKGHKI